jgi:hypothetical protein
MVPLGEFAFIPGTLYHTNDITVYLGEGYHAKVSSSNARDIIASRVANLRLDLKKEQKLLQTVYSKFGLTKDIVSSQSVTNIKEEVQLIDNGNGEIEIREPYVEDEPPKKYTKVDREINPSDEREIQEMFDKLAQEEEEDDSTQDTPQIDPVDPNSTEEEEFNKYFKKKVSFKEPEPPKQTSPMLGKVIERKTTPMNEPKEEPKKMSKFKQSRQTQ